MGTRSKKDVRSLSMQGVLYYKESKKLKPKRNNKKKRCAGRQMVRTDVDDVHMYVQYRGRGDETLHMLRRRLRGDCEPLIRCDGCAVMPVVKEKKLCLWISPLGRRSTRRAMTKAQHVVLPLSLSFSLFPALFSSYITDYYCAYSIDYRLYSVYAFVFGNY